MTTENKKLNVFIDAGNGDNTSLHDLVSEIALVKNMEHVETVFVFAKENNSIKDNVTKKTISQLAKAYEEYAGETFISVTDQLNKKPNKVIIHNTQNKDLEGKLNGDLATLKKDALMIHVPDNTAELNVLHLFTHKTPTDFENIQLIVPKGDATSDKLVMNMVKDAAKLRGLKINIRGAQAGGFFGLFGKKKYDVKAAEIVKKLLKEKKKFTDDVKDAVKDELHKYYGYNDKVTYIPGSEPDKKHKEAKNNVARALHTVEKLLAEAAEAAKPKKEKTPSYSTIVKMNDTKKAEHQKKKDAERATALGERGIKISKIKSAEKDNEKVKAVKLEKFEKHLIKTHPEKSAYKGVFPKPDLIIRHENDKSQYPSDTPCIVYNDTTLPILDLLLTAQFSEPTRLRKLFYEGTGTKKSGIVSKVKKGISKLGHEDLSYTRKRRSSSSKRVAAKKKSKAISRTPMENKIASNIKEGDNSTTIRTKEMVAKAVNTTNEALATKKAELKRLGFALFGEKRTKKKQLQANIAELEKKLKAKATPTATA
jgi:hypothetical protein